MNINVLEYLEMSTKLYPQKTVFADEEKEISYEKFTEFSQTIGSYLIKKYATKNKPIVVLINRNVESLTMFLGITYSGNFYVPVDLELPKERLKSMFDTISPVAILGLEEYRDTIKEFGFELESYENIINQEVDKELLHMVRSRAIDTDPLYAIFTSGSTGVPKAVLVSHRSVIDLVECFKTSFGFLETEVFGNQAPFDFDVSVKDIYSTLRNGATMQIIPKQLFVFPVHLISYLNERKITTIIWATTALCVFQEICVSSSSQRCSRQEEAINTLLISREIIQTA